MATPIPIHIDGLIYDKQPHGGISRNFTNLINSLVGKPDAEVTLHLPSGCAFPEGMHDVRSRPVPGIINLRPSRVFARLGASLTERRRSQFWSSVRDGIFHSSYYSSPDGLRIPQVLTMHDMIFEDYPELFSSAGHLHQHIAEKRRALDRSNGLIFPSNFAKSRTAAHFSLGDRPMLVSPHAVDPRFLDEPSPDDVAEFRRRTTTGRPFLLHVGSRYLHKNVSKLVRAFSVWDKRHSFVLVLAGGGQLNSDEAALIESCGAQDRILVLPQLSNDDLLLAYHSAAAFVFPSFSEGFGFPLLEALACGCPTASSNAASLPEVGGSAPVYFEPMDIESICAGLDEVVGLTRDDSRWREARMRARQRTWDQVALEYCEFYRLVADRTSVGSTGPTSIQSKT